MMKKILPLLLLPGYLLAQPVQDSLKEVEVKSRKRISSSEQILQQNTGSVQRFDSTQLTTYQGRSVAALISEQSPVFIKSYGYNSLSTLSFRGASAAQSLVLWQGVPVNNPALGVADLSLLPVFFSDEISIAYGGSSALLGSGNVGGALLLDHAPPNFSRSKKPGVYLSAGSFGQRTAGMSADLPAGREKDGRFSIKALGQIADNDFSYRDESGVEQRMDNARQRSGQVMAGLARRLPKGTLTLRAWGQYGLREIPPALFESQSLKQQTDKALRLAAGWQHQNNQLKLAYIAEGLDYADAAIGLVSHVLTHRLFLSDTWQRQFKAHELTLMLPLQLDWLDGAAQTQSQIALAGSYQYRYRRWRFNAQARGGWYNDRFALTPGLGISWQPLPWLSGYVSLQRSFRQPTLNELYYQPGGNPQLKPEEGWSGEGGYQIDYQKSGFRLRHEGALFARAIKNWIIWYGGAIWTPHNIAEVYSRGLETHTSLTKSWHRWEAMLFAQTAYVLSTTEKSHNPLDNSIGKQLPYVPRYNYRLGFRLGWQQWLLTAQGSFTGYRFVTSDESQFLEPYAVSGAQLAYRFAVNKQAVRLQVGCQNLLDAAYEVVAYRPMPGRVWQFSLYLSLQ